MEVEKLNKSYGEKKLIDNLSFSLNAGETLLIKGVSGRGKTTLLGMILGIKKPDGGCIRDVPEKVSAVFQEDRLPEEFTAAACIKMTAPRCVTRQQIVSHLNRLGLGGTEDMKIKKLSGGMRRRVAIARAIICNADLVVLDEPFTGLDRETKRKVAEYIREYTADKMLILVSHDDEDAALFNARVLEL